MKFNSQRKRFLTIFLGGLMAFSLWGILTIGDAWAKSCIQDTDCPAGTSCRFKYGYGNCVSDADTRSGRFTGYILKEAPQGVDEESRSDPALLAEFLSACMQLTSQYNVQDGQLYRYADPTKDGGCGPGCTPLPASAGRGCNCKVTLPSSGSGTQ